MGESHRSLRDDYEVSCRKLDLMVSFANSLPGTFGARMTGGGFGGCTVNVVTEEMVEEFKTQIANNYKEATGITPEIHVCRSAEGAKEIIFE